MGLSKTVAIVTAVWTVFTWVVVDKVPLSITVLLGQAILNGVAVSFCALDHFAPSTTKLLGKDFLQGSFALWSSLLFWPYHIGLQVKLFLRIIKGREPLYNKIPGGWYLGGWPPSHSALPQADKLAVVDCTCELPKKHRHAYLCVPMWDTHAPTVEQIDSAVQWALRKRQEGHELYIHCAHGHGRSATVLAAALITLGQAPDIQGAVALLRKERPKVKLNARQMRAITQWYEAYRQRAPLSHSSQTTSTPTAISTATAVHMNTVTATAAAAAAAAASKPGTPLKNGAAAAAVVTATTCTGDEDESSGVKKQL